MDKALTTVVTKHKDKIVVSYPSRKLVILNVDSIVNSKDYGIYITSELVKVWGYDFVLGLVALNEITEIFSGIKGCLDNNSFD